VISGFVLLDKDSGVSSHRAVKLVSLLFDRIKAGHAGTLDPLATGMLPVLLGEATRFAASGLEADKSYEVTIDLSFQTDTLDSEGNVIARFDRFPDAVTVALSIKGFIGDQEQVPPKYSAISVGGKRAYTLARMEQDVTLPSRRITVHDIKPIEIRPPVVRLHVHCSKGTYIRSLARDLGQNLSVGGCVTQLRRTGIGSWPAEAMVSMHELERDGIKAVQPLVRWLEGLSSIELDVALARRFLLGQRLPLPEGTRIDQQEYRVSCGKLLLGTGHIRSGWHGMAILHPYKTLPSSRKLLAMG